MNQFKRALTLGHTASCVYRILSNGNGEPKCTYICNLTECDMDTKEQRQVLYAASSAEEVKRLIEEYPFMQSFVACIQDTGPMLSRVDIFLLAIEDEIFSVLGLPKGTDLNPILYVAKQLEPDIVAYKVTIIGEQGEKEVTLEDEQGARVWFESSIGCYLPLAEVCLEKIRVTGADWAWAEGKWRVSGVYKGIEPYVSARPHPNAEVLIPYRGYLIAYQYDSDIYERQLIAGGYLWDAIENSILVISSTQMFNGKRELAMKEFQHQIPFAEAETEDFLTFVQRGKGEPFTNVQGVHLFQMLEKRFPNASLPQLIDRSKQEGVIVEISGVN